MADLDDSRSPDPSTIQRTAKARIDSMSLQCINDPGQ